MNGSKDIKIIPIIQGASAAGRILTGIAIIAVAWMTWGTALAAMPVYGAATWGLGMSLVIGGVIELLSPKPNLTGSTTQDSNESYLFNGTYNSTKQGTPIGLGYG